MFVKYNAVLRSYTGNSHLTKTFVELCDHNRYVTTLHVINSAIVKLGRLMPATKVYRGIAGMGLPDTFWEPNDMNVCGGVEYAFMSTTSKWDVALQYSLSRDGQMPIVFEMEMGMIDRGADLRWCSQYPHEAEILCARRACQAPPPASKNTSGALQSTPCARSLCAVPAQISSQPL